MGKKNVQNIVKSKHSHGDKYAFLKFKKISILSNTSISDIGKPFGSMFPPKVRQYGDRIWTY